MYQDNRDEDVEIDLVEVFHLMLKRWWLILISAIVFAAAAFGYGISLLHQRFRE